MKILVLGGGADQVAFIKELQKREHDVILLDYLPNPPAKSIVNKHIQASTLDSDKVKEWAQKEKIDIICTACTDQALLTVAKVSAELGLPCYISYEKALLVTNKYYMKKRMIETHVPTSKYITLSSIKDIDNVSVLNFPLVVKPADCNSSKGVIKVNNIIECQKYLINALSLSRSSTAIVEEFKEGDEVSADFYINGKSPIFLSASVSKKIRNRNSFTIVGSVYPAINENEKSKLIEIASKIVGSFTLTDTPLLIQLIRAGDDFYVIEFSARMGGGSKYRLIEEISGVNIMSNYVDLILGHKPEICPDINQELIRMIYIYTAPGKVCSFKGLDSLINDGTIKEKFQYKSFGSEITKAETSSDRVLGLLVTAENDIVLKQKIAKINNSLSVENECGEDIMMHCLLEE